MSLVDYATQSCDLDVFQGGQVDQDELFLKKLSVYATLRPGDLQRCVQTDRHTSLREFFKGQREEGVPESEKEQTADKLELQDYELSVKGFELDSRIGPGFRYTVRYIGSNEYLFGGEARRLESIGLGYGRRLTFKGDTLNFNDCYFWTDSSENGFAFTIEAIKEGDEYRVVDSEGQYVGTVCVQKVDFPQVEMDTDIKDTTVTKTVKVRMACLVKQNSLNHSLININSRDFEMVEGIAVLVKERGCKEATVKCIKNVNLQSLGKCTLHSEF